MTDERGLILAAIEAARKAYSPYSRFCVGAALLTKDGKIYTGCNIENASYPATICAERVAISTAVAAGEREFEAIAVVGGKREDIDSGRVNSECPPCGVCRQVMAEFCGQDFKVVLGTLEKYKVYTLSELLPHGFDSDSM